MYRCKYCESSDLPAYLGCCQRTGFKSPPQRQPCVAWLFFLLVAGPALFLGANSAATAESLEATSFKATTSGTAKQDALNAISSKRIDSRYRQAVHQVLNDSSLYRRLPTQMVDCDPKLFTFLSQNPETLVEIWRKLGITRIELHRQSENSFRLADNSGTTGKLVIVEQNCDDRAQNRIVMYAEGSYEGKPFRRPITAQCVLLLRSGSMRETNGRDFVAVQLDSFIRIERTSIELFAKAIHPLVGKTADRNFADTVQFISSFSQAAETRPATIERLVSALPHISPESQDKLIQIAYQCGSRDSGRAPPSRK